MNPTAQLKSIKRQMRQDGYRPVARYGKGEWLNEDGYSMRTVRLDPTLGWHWVPSISRTLLCRAVRRDVAARS